MDNLKPGDRIRFPKEISEPATGDHPAFLMAKKNGTGTVQKVLADSDPYDYAVFWDEWQALPFAVKASEIEAL